MISTLQLGGMGRIIKRPAGGGSSSYNTLVAAAAPNLWWKLDETSGTNASDSGSANKPGTLTGGATFGGSVSISAPTGLAGVAGGINMSEPSVTDIRGDITGVKFGGSSTDSWTILLCLAGGSGSCYLASRQNEAAIIHNFVAGKVEFFSLGGTGSDPRPGSQIDLSDSDTNTAHIIVYRYDNGQWAGFLDGSNVFNVARSFSLANTVTTCYLGSDSSTSVADRKFWDFQIYNRALTNTEISDFWAARNIT
jgi:hypothetical protein